VILVTCAVGKELAFLRPQPHVELLVTGVGPVEAAAAVSRALAQSTYDLVVSAGIGGAFGALGGILIAQATGWTLQLTGSYTPILFYAGIAYLLAFAVIQLLVPKMEPAPL